MSFLGDILAPFALGLLTPLTAICVLPLYPGFLAYLSNQFSRGKGEVIGDKKEKNESNNKGLALFGVLVVAGVLTFMLGLGLIFTTLLQASLTRVIGLVSPIAFAILGLVSLVLIFNINLGRFLPRFNSPVKKNPLWSALLFGFFFGAIVIPCNPAFVAVFFARALLFDNFATSMLGFLFFGLGLGAPLLVFSLFSVKWSNNIIGFLTKYKRLINLAAGIVMLGISIYYLVFVFNVLGSFGFLV